MVTLNYTYKKRPKTKQTCACGNVFLKRAGALFCEDCRKKHVSDYFQKWYKKNKEKLALARKVPKTKKPCVVCGTLVLGAKSKKYCPKCWREKRLAYGRKYYLDNKNKKMVKCTQRCKDE